MDRFVQACQRNRAIEPAFERDPMRGFGNSMRLILPAVMVFVLSCFVVMPLQASVRATNLHSGWQFRAMGTPPLPAALEWHPATVPGVVQTDLLQNKLIPDPFYGTNEAQLQWIGLTDWEYQTKFPVDAATFAQ